MRSFLAAARWKRGPVLAGLALSLGLVLLLHSWIPNRVGNLGSLVESLLPWLGLFVPLLLAGALWRRSPSAVVALLLPVVAWFGLFGARLGDRSHHGGDLTVVEQNVGAGNADHAGTAHALDGSGADLLALVELTPEATVIYEKELAASYPFHTVQGTVGLWSKFPLAKPQLFDIVDFGPAAARVPTEQKLVTNRALRTTVTTTRGPLTVYVAHPGSVRVNPRAGFFTFSRNIGVDVLGKAVAADPSDRIVLLGDLNGSTDDRALAPLTDRLHSVQDTAGDGFGFTWPAAFPLVRIDQILARGLTAKSSWVLPANGSDHRPVAAALSWP